jgi:hypothetical protein
MCPGILKNSFLNINAGNEMRDRSKKITIKIMKKLINGLGLLGYLTNNYKSEGE